MFIVKVFVLSLCIYLVSAHSWMQCADYTEENGRFWDASKCRGYPRGYGEKYQYHGYGFGNDAGYNTQPQENAVCQASFGTADMGGYNAPSYKPGQRVCMAWPPKNHVAARCNNININDFGTQILRSGVNPTRDPAFSEFQLVHDFGASQPGAGEGFQNCPDFCNNNDKALCTGCFNVPADLAQGKYVFLWLWEFNRGEKYTTCFDVTISNSVTSAPPTVLAKTTPDAFAAGGSAVTGNTGNTGAATGNTGTATGTQNTGSNNNNDDGEVKTTKGYSGGIIAAAVIVTFIAVAAIFVGVFWTARTFPHSKVGSFVHQLMSK